MNPQRGILILEAGQSIPISAAEHLRREGFDCIHAATIPELCELQEECEIEVIIADAETLGPAAARRVRSSLQQAHPPCCILVTDADTPPYDAEDMVLPISSSIRRPFHFGDLLAAVKRATAEDRSTSDSSHYLSKAMHAETLYKQLLEAAADSIISANESGEIIMVNDATVGMFGYAKEELIGSSIEMLVPAGFRDHHRRLREGFVENPRKRRMGSNMNIVARRKDGKEIPVDIALSHVTGPDGLTVTAVIRDMTARREVEEALSASEERLRILYDNNPSMYFTITPGLSISTLNQYGARQLGYQPPELIGLNAVESIICPESRADFIEGIAQCLEDTDAVHQWEGQMACRGGQTLWVKQTARAASDNAGNRFVFMVCEDITEARELAQQVSFQATHDSLTGLVNRRELERRLAHAIGSAHADASEHAVCYLDLDQFKIINDTSGHAAGDELLRQIAQLLCRHVRQHDTVARLGGDEFAILLEHCSTLQAEFIANAIRKSIAEYFFAWEGRRFAVGVSIGVVPINQHTGDVTAVLRTVDSACYVAKEEGRNRVHIYHDDDEEISRRHGEMSWVNRLNDALAENRFELLCQPIVPVNRDKHAPDHYELLIRLLDETEGHIGPNKFLAAAERYNLSARIDQWVINAAFAWMADGASDTGTWCSINLSGQSLGQPEFLQFVKDKIESYGISPKRICFEITETAAIANLARAQAFIGSLKRLGCMFALDDFGSGLSSFAYLHSLPVDLLKIDGTFIVDLPRDPVKLAIVRSINEVGHTMGKKTVAEFVESQAVLETLKELGVDYAQGFGIGRPRPLRRSAPLRAIG